jgi:hypothetical protein
MKKKRYILASFIILLTGVMYLSIQAQQNNSTHRAKLSGHWKAKEAISIGGNIFCSYDARDRMASKSMKIVEQADYLTIENPDSGVASAKNLEKLTFDGKTRQISLSQENRKTFSVKLSTDGQTMTIKSIVYFMTFYIFYDNRRIKIEKRDPHKMFFKRILRSFLNNKRGRNDLFFIYAPLKECNGAT